MCDNVKMLAEESLDFKIWGFHSGEDSSLGLPGCLGYHKTVAWWRML
jgi:hypothetical protein